MRIQQRLRRLETNIPTVSTGQPLPPAGITPEQYQQLVTDKRQELGLSPSDALPLLSLVGATR